MAKTHLIALALLFAACSNEPFRFEVAVGPIPGNVTAVVVDGIPLMIAVDNGVRSVDLRKEFASYEEGKLADAFDFMFIANDVVVNTGTAKVGACAQFCTTQSCPAGNSVTLEQISITPLENFGPFQFSCVTCDGSGKTQKICT